jgi:uncharacterized protein YdeI (YjbR/CyaY-like superfamily)
MSSIERNATGATYFRSPAEFRSWLAKHHARASELLVGFHRKDSGRPSLPWPESVAEALCFGWIDGIRRRVDETRYTIRFTPRRTRSIWSNVNIRIARELVKSGRMRPAGLRAFEARKEYRSGIYSFEQRTVELPPKYARVLRKNAKAHAFFESSGANYRKAAMWWIVSAKQEATRLRRLASLVENSAKGERVPPFRPSKRER